jgi:protein O-mannosyl-transferase
VSTQARTRAVLLGAALAVAAALYAPFLGHPFIWDDYVQISENGAVTQGVPLHRYFVDRETTSTRSDYNDRIYRPLRNVAFRGLWAISSAAPAQRTRCFLGANLALYLLGGYLVYRLCSALARDPLAAAVAAAAWLLLPVHAEDVLYASALGDLLSFDLQLCGLLLVLRALDGPRRAGVIAGALALHVVALFVKEMAITSVVLVPVLVLSERRAAAQDAAGRRAAIALVVGHALLGVAYLAMRTAVLGRVGQEDVRLIETLWGVADAPWLLLEYLRLALMPLGHAPDYGSGVPSVGRMIACAAIGLALFAACHLRPERGVRSGAWLYVVGLGPVLHLVPLWTKMADRFLLLPSVGLAVIGAGLLARALPRRRPLYLGIAAAACCAWAVGTALEARRFQSDEALFAYGVEEVPDSNLAHHNLGLTLLKRGEIDRAIVHLTRAHELGRRDPRLYHHLAGALEARGRYEDAERVIARAIKLKPDYGNAYAQRAALERRRGDLDAAERSLAEADRYEHSWLPYESERAAQHVARGRLGEAHAVYRSLAEHVGSDARLWEHAAQCAAHAGSDAEARLAAERCAALDPARPGCARILGR